MFTELQQVAARIRELREIAGVSAETLARELHLPLEKYLEFESGKADIPVSVLYQIANRFHVELTAILTGEEPKLHTYCVVRSGEGVSVERRKDYKYQSLAFNFVHKKAEPFLVTVDPQPEEEPVSLNSHPGQEFDYVLEGSMKIVIDGHEVILKEGDSIYYDSSFMHGMKAIGEKPVKFLAVVF